jgi:hypothetical protein
MKLENNTVYSFKLNSGEELIGKVTGQDLPWVQIEYPVSVAPAPQGMGLIPSSFTADPRHAVALNMNNVVFWCVTDEGVKTKYIEATTGIRVPERKIVMG